MADLSFENDLWDKGYKNIAAVDEVGYGALVGDVYTAAVIFPNNIDGDIVKDINDSKTKKEADRERLYDLIIEVALDWKVGIATVEEIENINVYWARFLAARRALSALRVEPDFVLMDGNKEIPEIGTPQQTIVKGDTKSISIAAASIIAKVSRDRYMVGLSKKVNQDYDWLNNKGYGAPKHLKALEKHGKTEWHRSQFIRKLKVGESNGF